MGLAVFRQKLIIVSLLVASLALPGRSLEPRLVICCGFVTLAARYRPVRSEERIFCFRMIEAIDVCPGLHAVASLATKNRSVRASARHLFVEFALVRVFVTCRAGSILETERQDFVRAPG